MFNVGVFFCFLLQIYETYFKNQNPPFKIWWRGVRISVLLLLTFCQGKAHLCFQVVFLRLSENAAK